MVVAYNFSQQPVTVEDLGVEGALATEVKAALQDARERPSVLSMVCGLGGRDVTLKEITEVYDKAKGGQTGPTWL